MPIEVTEKYIRIRQKDPDQFDEMRIITISEEEGIKAVYGRKKDSKDWEIQAYLFDKEKWTKEKAQNWVDENKGKTARLICRYLGKTMDLDGKVPEYIHLIPLGKWEVTPMASGPIVEPFEITKEYCQKIVVNFDKVKADIPIDYEHQTDLTWINAQPAPAAGWIDKVEVRKDGLWGHVKDWTEKAEAMIRDREYRYLSPVWVDEWINPETGEQEGPAIFSCGLTNTPFFDELTPLVAKFGMKQIRGKEPTMTLEELVAKLGEILGLEKPTEETVIAKVEELMGIAKEVVEVVEEESPAPEAVQAAVKQLKIDAAITAKTRELLKLGKDADEKAISAKLFTLTKPKDPKEQVDPAEFEKVKMQLAEEKAAKLVDEAMKAGKLTPAQKDWAMKYAQDDPEGFGKWMATQPVVVPVGERPREEPRPKAGVTEQQRHIAGRLGVDPEEVYGGKKKEKGGK